MWLFLEKKGKITVEGKYPGGVGRTIKRKTEFSDRHIKRLEKEVQKPRGHKGSPVQLVNLRKL